MINIQRTLEHRVAVHGEHVLSPEDKAELYRLRGVVTAPITEPEPEAIEEDGYEDDGA